jgi:hypothetical protein
VELTKIAEAVVRAEPGAFDMFIAEGQGRSADELSAAALVLASSKPPNAGQPSRGWKRRRVVVLDTPSYARSSTVVRQMADVVGTA